LITNEFSEHRLCSDFNSGHTGGVAIQTFALATWHPGFVHPVLFIHTSSIAVPLPPQNAFPLGPKLKKGGAMDPKTQNWAIAPGGKIQNPWWRQRRCYTPKLKIRQ